MDLTRCPHCKMRMKAVATSDGRTGLQCLRCENVDPHKADPVKWVDASSTKAA